MFMISPNILLAQTAVPNPQPKPLDLKSFSQKVVSIYKEMTFSGVELSLSKVILRDVPVGIAFAHFDRRRNKRYILLNYRYFLNEWKKDSTKTQYQLEGILAHEWAHHFLGHVFERGDIVKERDADLIAGRILYELGTSSQNESIQEQRLTGALSILPDHPVDKKHLSKEARIFLVQKGFLTGEVIFDYQKNKNLDAIRESLQTKFRNIEKNKNEEITNLASKYKDDNLKIEKQLDSLQKLDTVNVLNVASIRQVLSKKRDSLQIAKTNLLTSYETESTTITQKYETSKNVELKNETIYNLLYLDNPNAIMNDDLLRPYGKDKSDAGVYSYTLKGGIKITFDENKFDKNEKSVAYKDSIVAISATPASWPFLYQFMVDRSTYYIDQYCNLWTETIAAKAIQNKLFLQKRKIINP
ncbi:hypothetical protein DVG78_22430 [Runella aurantiaca]|uniref:Uncharacterized protein n=1 Tax=Runella aurantiaca TaxID=2282308 RepID=A0A369I280_9BACT|nr:hypothetical protein DVG78_22430 [Runella aurantiaca]